MYKFLVAIAEKLVVPQNISNVSDIEYAKEIAEHVCRMTFGLVIISAVVLVIVSFKIIKKIEARK